MTSGFAHAVEAQPLPRQRAFERLGFGMFIHFGLYSQLGQGEWVWHHHKMPREQYLKLKDSFNPKDFDAKKIVATAREAGMRYICLTTRHHEGFSLYDTRGLNTYDAPHTSCERDLIAEFSAACEAAGMGKFFYHTTLDWWHPDFDAPGRWEHYLDYLNRSVDVLCRNYGKVDGFWFDGNWARKDRDWKEDALYAVIRETQPEAIIVNNSSTGARGAEGHPEVDIRTFEQGKPNKFNPRGRKKYLASEMCDTVNSHWGIGDFDLSQKSPAEVIQRIAASRRYGANYLMNVGPTGTGAIPGYETELLKLVGRWMKICPEAVYEARPTDLLCRGNDFVLQHGATYYAFIHNVPIRGNMHLLEGESGEGLKTVHGLLPRVTKMSWADSGEALSYSQSQEKEMLTFESTPYPYGKQLVVRIAKIETQS